MQSNTVKLGRSIPSAFTLIELMVVMVVMAIMVAIAIPMTKYISKRAREASQKVYIEKIKNALEDYRAAYGEYPITPATNTAGVVINQEDVKRHFTDHLPGGNIVSSYTVDLTTNTIECIQADSGSVLVDHCLTYPLMQKQRDAGARPFMDFKDFTVMYIGHIGGRKDKVNVKRRKKGGSGWGTDPLDRLFADPVNKPMAIDPISQRQWKYYSENGLTYTLTTNAF